jgi:hypothetical protein
MFDFLIACCERGFLLRERSSDTDEHPCYFIAERIVHRNPVAMPGVVFRQFLDDLYRVRFRGEGTGVCPLSHVRKGAPVRNCEAIPFHGHARSSVCCTEHLGPSRSEAPAEVLGNGSSQPVSRWVSGADGLAGHWAEPAENSGEPIFSASYSEKALEPNGNSRNYLPPAAAQE